MKKVLEKVAKCEKANSAVLDYWRNVAKAKNFIANFISKFCPKVMSERKVSEAIERKGSFKKRLSSFFGGQNKENEGKFYGKKKFYETKILWNNSVIELRKFLA